MKQTRHDRIVLSHENAASSLVTWWKACFLAPPWLYPLLPAIGGCLHLCDLDALGFASLLIFCLGYLGLDLKNKNIVITREYIRRGLTELSLARISKVVVSNNMLGHPTILRIENNTGTVMKLHLLRMSGDDIQTLINVVQRMSPSCRIDSRVDFFIRYKRAKKLATIYDTSTTTYVKYHVDRSWEGIPQNIATMFKGWSKLFGPIGILPIFLPLSIFLLCLCWNTAFAQWSSYDQHQNIYNFLIYVVTTWSTFQASACDKGLSLLAEAIHNPFLLLLSMSIVTVTAASYFRAAFGANRITMDATELSLDSWQYLSSFNLASLRWSSLTKIALTNTANHQRLVLTSDKGKSIELDVKGIDEVDRARFLNTLKRHATHCEIPAAIEELLDPPTTRSYTQLWLQSITQAPKDTVLKPIEAGSLLEGGRYEVIRKLGAGGQGAAYLCHDLGDKNKKPAPTVAVKEMLIPPYLSTVIKKGLIESFVAEATMLKSIDSPNVVGLLDYFVEERGAYLVLEHIEGSTLRDLVLETGALDAKLIASLLPQLLDILKLLHRNGIVHRDFTPDNLILRPDGLLKLIDFNVAQDESEGTTATIVGKHAYVPPEQFRGKPTTQSDLYALGATMFFLLTGDDPEPISQSSLPEHLKTANADINALIQMCTATEVEERVASVDALIEKFASSKAASSATEISGEPDTNSNLETSSASETSSGPETNITPESGSVSESNVESDSGFVIALTKLPEKKYARKA
jgi:hypothetical protein